MKTIEWLVGLIPKNVRALCAVLLIAISVLASTLVYVYHELQTQIDDRKDIVARAMRECELKTDSLNRIIMVMKDDSKREVIQRLEQIIHDQKDDINDQKKVMQKQEVIKRYNKSLINKINSK